MPTVTFKLKGTRSVQKKLNRLAAQFEDRLPIALQTEAELIMTTSKRDHVPVDLGTLRATGHVEKVRRVGKTLSVRLVYGGPSAPYALAVHEHLSSHSPPTWRGITVSFGPGDRGPKYLERPLVDAAPGMAARLAARMKL